MEPGFRDREYHPAATAGPYEVPAAMEPGFRDREYDHIESTEAGLHVLQWSPVLETGNTRGLTTPLGRMEQLQWSPVLETGNTGDRNRIRPDEKPAAMEPGFRDREYEVGDGGVDLGIPAAMEPGFRDREYQVRQQRFLLQVRAAMEPGFRDREYCQGRERVCGR